MASSAVQFAIHALSHALGLPIDKLRMMQGFIRGGVVEDSYAAKRSLAQRIMPAVRSRGHTPQKMMSALSDAGLGVRADHLSHDWKIQTMAERSRELNRGKHPFSPPDTDFAVPTKSPYGSPVKMRVKVNYYDIRYGRFQSKWTTMDVDPNERMYEIEARAKQQFVVGYTGELVGKPKHVVQVSFGETLMRESA